MAPARRTVVLFAALSGFLFPSFAAAQTPGSASHTSRPSSAKKEARAPSASEELQKTIEAAGNDRAALVRNLEAFLKIYPDAPERPQIYRALVEACLQLRDDPRATDYAERIVALTPDDMSITLLAIQLLERRGDEPALRRAVSYSSRVLDYVKNSSMDEKSPRVSPEEWEAEKKRDQMNLLLLRGRLESKIHDASAARMDFEASYALVPNAGAALKLGELDELGGNYNAAATEYARAFALADSSAAGVNRREIRQKLGNVWRVVHASEAGLGEFLLKTYDEINSASAPRTAKNSGSKDPYDFVLRAAPSGRPFPLAPFRGQVLVINFWATWCGPCRALEPLYERVAAQFQGEKDVHFLAADCDEDETLVPAYLEEVKLKTTVVFSDGLDFLFAVDSFPTVLVLDRSGKIAFRSSGFGDDRFEQNLSAVVRRALSSPASLAPAR
jgi:thiol-disulfide isomerase/thioredoxin